MCISDITRIPVATSDFAALRDANQIYADKTAEIFNFACARAKIFLARPRRFGKTLLTSTLASLFKYGLRDFKGLAIADLWKDKTYDVVRLDFSSAKDFRNFKEFKEFFFTHLSQRFATLGFSEDRSDSNIIEQISSWLGRQPLNSIVCLIDEYDAPLTACIHDEKLFNDVRLVISKFFSAIKSNDSCMRFIFMTGITKYSNTGIFSGFNTFTDISLDEKYGTLLGLTEEELRRYFSDYLENAGKILNLPTEAVIDKLRENYDGFSFDEHASTHVFCPWSVLKFLQNPEKGFKEYWYLSAGKPAVLTKYLRNHDLEKPESYAENRQLRLEDLDASREYPDLDLTVLLTQAGYLTIKSVSRTEVVTVGYPNREAAVAMARFYSEKLLANGFLKLPEDPWIGDLLAQGNVEATIQQFNLVVNSIDYANYPISDEASCRAYIQVLLIGAAMVPHVELHSALGRSDLEVDAGAFRWIFEFKFSAKTKDVGTALEQAAQQIESRRYGQTPHGKSLKRIALVFCAEERQFAAFREVPLESPQ